ncbi:hypothetical protein H4582DRAFT_2073186 [Lactarius indigo]|nr:hypothetical protein H4582DRAFT_2073186 [Lactarius indigo]
MTNFHDPKVVQADGCASFYVFRSPIGLSPSLAVAFIKVLYVVGGIYIWEFFTSLWFEWQIITGRRSYRWSIWLYSGCRLSALFAIITIFVGFNVTTPINCRAWLVCVFFFAYSAFVFASALIVLRIVAIWERNWLVCTIAIAAWLVNIAFYIRSLRRYGDVGMYGLWRFLHRQGLLWLVLVTVAEIPTTVFIILNLNDYFNLMFQTPELIHDGGRFWSFHGAFTSPPPTMDGIQLSQHAVGEPEPSPTVVETFDATSPTIAKNVHKVHSFTSTVVDSPV